MNDLNLYQGRNPEKVAKDYQSFSKFSGWMMVIAVVVLLFFAI